MTLSAIALGLLAFGFAVWLLFMFGNNVIDRIIEWEMRRSGE